MNSQMSIGNKATPLPRAGSGLLMPCTLGERIDYETEQRVGNGKQITHTGD